MLRCVLLSLFCLLFAVGLAAAQQENPNGIYIIFDASGSMWEKLPDQMFRIDAAKKVLLEFVSGDFEGYQLAMRVYGHRTKGDCKDSELVVPFGPPKEAAEGANRFMKDLNPLGMTPITYSLTEALKDFGDRHGEIILISDGIESCNADPCALIREWRAKDVKIKVHVVGLGLDEKSKGALRCISEAAGTEYHDASSASQLKEELAKIQEQAIAGGFHLKGKDREGQEVRVRGNLSQKGKESIQVSSGLRYQVEPGQYTLTAGMMTENGNLYRAVTKMVDVADKTGTRVEVQVETPPSARVKFMDGDTELPASGLVYAFQGGKEQFHFRAIDTVYVDEGAYEFRPDPSNRGELVMSESFAAGDRKEIVFRFAHTVKVTVKMTASGSGIAHRRFNIIGCQDF